MREALSFKLRWPFTVYQLAVTNLSLPHAAIKSGRIRVRDGAVNGRPDITRMTTRLFRLKSQSLDFYRSCNARRHSFRKLARFD